MQKAYDFSRFIIRRTLGVFMAITTIYSIVLIVKFRTIDYWLLRLSWILFWSVVMYDESENHYIKRHPDQKVKWGARLIIFCSLSIFSVSEVYKWHYQMIFFFLMPILIVASWILEYIRKQRYKASSEAFVEWLKEAEVSHWLLQDKRKKIQ